jgi:thiol-disulfide isomerase/thioredoxin
MVDDNTLFSRRAFVLGTTTAMLLGLGAQQQPAIAAPPSSKAPRKAPLWDISKWLNSDGGNIDSYKGQVVVVDFFQLWCPGCRKFSIPLMNHWEKNVFVRQAQEKKIAFISIHTVFEGHDYQNPKRLKNFIKEKEITHPVGLDRHRNGSHVPETMRRYSTGGTPEMAIIDKQGMIRFQKLGYFEPDWGEHLIRTLLAE